MTLASFYVLISRVRELGGLRLLQRDEAALSAVSQLKTDEYLHGWERGYDAETGLWDDALAARAVRDRVGQYAADLAVLLYYTYCIVLLY